MKLIEFFTFRDAPAELRVEWSEAIESVLDSNQFIGGKVVEKFENEWCEYLKVSNTIGTGNGYDALFIALVSMQIGPGDFVAVPSHTFIATWLAVSATGATPVGIDCDENGLIDLSILETAGNNFSAVIPVHMHGLMVDMPRLLKWADKRGVRVIEDCAQSHGAQIGGKKAGTWGDFGAFSFYPTKNLGALGDAGALVTNDNALAEIARSFSNYGRIPTSKYTYDRRGINSRLDPMQASVLSVNLRYLDKWNSQRLFVASRYSKALASLGIETLPFNVQSVFHHFIVISQNRDSSQKLLEKNGIRTEIHYPESAQLSFEKITYDTTNLQPKNSTQLAKKTLSLPISPWLSIADIDYVIEILSKDEVISSFNFKE